MEPMKAWIPRLKQIRSVRAIWWFDDGYIKIDVAEKETGYEPYMNHRDNGITEFTFIRPTPFKDINGDPGRLLWEGDIVETSYSDGGELGVIFFNNQAGQWGIQYPKHNGPLSGLLFCGQRHFGSQYIGNVFENPELVPWWKGEES